MSRILWLTAFMPAASTGCGDSPVGPVRGSFTSTLTTVELPDPTEVGTFCPSPPCACEPSICAGPCDNSRDNFRCDANLRRR